MNGSPWTRIGAVLGLFAVAAGAFGAHVLKQRYAFGPNELATFETAVRYQMYHALALLAVGHLASTEGRSRRVAVAGWSFLVGTLLFSGSLYGLVLTGARWLGPITPLGGVGFLIGWLALALAAGPQSRGKGPTQEPL
jgi:uncharacterized membrane protein YgdD (TMEM256/DUF423 family)